MGTMHQTVCACQELDCPGDGGGYFVTARRDTSSGQYRALIGPYETHEGALRDVDLGRQMAERVDPRAVWYSYGTVRIKEGPLPEPAFASDVVRALKAQPAIEARLKAVSR